MGRLLQISDVHFGAENVAACRAVLDYAGGLDCDLILVTGDITQKGGTAEFGAASQWLQALPQPRLVIVGNHDVPYWDAVARAFHPWRAFERATGASSAGAQFVSDELMVCGLTTARGWQARLNWSKGVMDLEDAQSAIEALHQAPAGALRIIACHHPLIEMAGAPVTGGVRRGDEAAHRFAQAGVDLVVSGHVHVPFALPIQKGDGRCYAVGCGTLSRRLRGVPASFNQIDWTDTDITVTVMAWDGQGFAPSQAWILPRRRDSVGEGRQGTGQLETAR